MLYKINKKDVNLVSILIAFIILISNPMWFTWNIRFQLVMVFFLLLCSVLILRPSVVKNNRVALVKRLPVFVVFFVFFVIISSLVGGIQTYLLVSSILILIFPLITPKEKKYGFVILTKLLATIVGVSLTAWLVHNFIFTLP